MENDLEISDRLSANVMANGHTIEASHAAAAAAISSSVHSGSITGLPIAATNASPAKALSNIQPKIPESSVGSKRQIVPKSDGLTTAVQQLNAQPAANFIVPQGIQHVLINGQLYPVIQTANGTHLLIQQPVGQVQTAGKQLFTAQPIQLGALQPLTTNATTASQPSSLPHAGIQSTSSQAKSSCSQSDILTSVDGASASSVAPVLPQMTSQIAPTNSDKTNTTANAQPNACKTNNGATKYTKAPLAVDSRTQQLLTRIQSQIDAFKSKPSLDASAKNTLLQLQEAQQKVLTSVRSQAQQAHGAQQASNGVTPPQPSPFVHPSPQFLQHQLPQSNVKEKSLIIKPAADGCSPVNEENVAAIIAAFTNVKVGTQIYNIQLMEDQKRLFVEQMSKMDAEQQHVYLTQQQTQILQTVFKNQQELQMKAQLQNQQQTMTPFSHQPAIQPPANPLAAQSKPRPTTRPSSGRRSANRGRKGYSPASTPPRAPVPTITLPDPVKPAAKKPRSNPQMSTKRIGEKMLQQIMKDQEVLLKPGNHKKPFTNKNQVKERLLRFHLFYTAESHKAYRRLQEEQLYKTTAHETVLGKEKLMDQFRSQLWRESIDPSQAGESILIAELLLQDEKEALEKDRLLECEDIERFKELYQVPEKDPTPPLPSPLSSPTLPADHLPAPKEIQPPGDLVKAGSASPSASDSALESPSYTSKTKPGQVDLVSPEAQLLTRVKRETAREARERRAAKRRETEAGLSGVALACPPVRKGKRGRKPKIARNAKAEESECAQEPLSPPHHQFTTDRESRLYQQHTDDESRSIPSPSTQVQNESTPQLEPADVSSERGSMTSHEKSDRQSEVSGSSAGSSDSENELIDIGSPPSPPVELTSPTASLPVRNIESPPLSGSSLLTASDANSPRKGFSIFSETVIEQSEQPYMPIHYTDDSTVYHSINTNESNPDISESTQQNHFTHQYYNDKQTHLGFGSAAAQGWGGNDSVPPGCTVDSDQTDASNPSSNSSSPVSTDGEVGGTAVTWEDNSFNVPSEVPSEGEETEHSTDEGEVEENNENAADDSPILPLRINKRKLGEYAWSNSSRTTIESSPAREVSIPPPIKLRIKRDSNDKWEAASSVSSYTSHVGDSDEEQLIDDSDTEQADQGVVDDGWDGEQQTYSDADESDVDDDSVPFEHYTSPENSNPYS